MKKFPENISFFVVCMASLAVIGFAQKTAEPHGIAVANMDRSVKPGDDFYLYANGDWIKRAVIPPDRAGVDVWTKLDDQSNKRTADLIAEIAKSNAPAGSGKVLRPAGIHGLRSHMIRLASIHVRPRRAVNDGFHL